MRAARFAILALLLLSALAAGRVEAATILVYHGFGPMHGGLPISLAAFEAQLNYLEQNGYKVISIEDLADCLDRRIEPPAKSVVIAIDDGWETVMQAFPILKARNLPFTLFLPMAYVANPGCRATLSREEIETLKTYPKVTFGNHSFLHSKRLSRPGQEDYAREDIQKSVARFREIFGRDTRYFAYPYGSTSEVYTRLLREAGFEYLFVTGASPVTASTSKIAIPRIAAHRMSLPLLASVLRRDEASRQLAKTDGPLLTEKQAAPPAPRLVE